MITKPITTEKILEDDQTQSDEHSVGGANKSVAGKTVAAEDETTTNGLEQIIGKTHTTEYTQMV